MSILRDQGTILFVDDEPRVTDALKRAFRSEPFQLLSATSAEEGLQALRQQAIDVVVSDEQMPGMSGSEFLSRVRVEHPTAIRIILSGHASLDAAVRAINEGEVYRFLLKPCNPTDLMITIRQALAHKRLEEQSRRLLREFQRQTAVITELERVSRGITQLTTDEHGTILLDAAEHDDGAIADLVAEMEQALESRTRRESSN